MSMTKDEIIKELEKTVAGAEILISLGYEEVNEYFDIFKAALSALRPITREQVERVWRGEWKENKNAAIESAICSKCKTVFQAYYGNYQFCPRCGAPMTDEAVDMVMNRFEEVKNA